MHKIALAVLLTSAFCWSNVYAQGAQRLSTGHPGSPPIGITIPTHLSAGPVRDLNITYHADGSFIADSVAAWIHQPGKWWWDSSGKFCFQFEGNSSHCKQDGLIGDIGFDGAKKKG